MAGEPGSDFLRAYADTPFDGKYRILERLGSGGMGDVYKAEHIFLGAIRVIKVIRPQISGSQDAHDRFLREARLATRVQHPNVAVLHDFAALPDGSHYMVWEYIDGENLAQRLRTRGTLPPREAVRLAIQALNGLEAVHRAGIVHRDIGPENLMIARDTNMLKIIDLGVAKVDDPDVAVTRTGIFVGKLRYAAPEQLGFLREDERIDARADLYSLGMVLYEMLAGRPPFEGKSPHDYIRLHSDETSLQLVDLERDLPGNAALQAILRRALARSREKRFQNATEFREALEQVEQTLPDLDATMRITPPPDTLRRETLREPVTTVRTAAPLPRRNVKPYAIIAAALVVVAILSIAATVWFMKQSSETITKIAEPSAAKPTQTAVNVVAEPTTTTVAPIETTTVAPVTQTHEQPATLSGASATQPTRPREPEPQPQPVPQPVAEAPVATYAEGGDRDTNGSLLEHLRSQLNGVTRVALQAGPMQDELTNALTHEIPTLTVVDGAPVTIRFNGTFEHLGRGRKRRAAQATISKNGRVIFRYEMPSEEYRVGATPVEAFVDVMSNAFQH
jgi:serine/threonine-protein kinase